MAVDLNYNPIKSDGCTGPNWIGWKPKWHHCCVLHDWDYAEGELTRKECDDRFKTCIANSGRPIQAWIAWTIVRIFGSSRYNTYKSER